MATLTVQSVPAAGVVAAAPVQITAWSTGDTILGSDVTNGVTAELTNTSGGSLDFRVSDPGFTPAGNAPANGYTTIAVPTGGQGVRVYIGPKNIDPATGNVKVGASTTHANFTIRLTRI